jgi:hypothetical protein
MSANHRPIPERILLLAALLAVCPRPAGAAGVWPPLPASERAAAEEADYRYAAGLYASFEQALREGRGDGADSLRAVRATLSLGRTDVASSLARTMDQLPCDLALMLRLADTKPLSDAETRRWRERCAGEDGEALYWRARLELARGDAGEARRLLQALLDREAGSIYAPAALELMETLPAAAVQARRAPESPGGLRLQWGVFRDAQRARRLAELVRSYGEATEILAFTKGGEELYRVCSEPYADEAAAQARGRELAQRHGLEFILYRSGEAP